MKESESFQSIKHGIFFSLSVHANRLQSIRRAFFLHLEQFQNSALFMEGTLISFKRFTFHTDPSSCLCTE